MRQLVLDIVRHLTQLGDEVSVRERDLDDGQLLILIDVPEEDRGRVIGRQGRTIGALRTLVSAVAERSGSRVRLDLVE